MKLKYLFHFLTAMPKTLNKAKIACLDFSLQKAKMKLGVSVVIDDPEKLMGIRERWVGIETKQMCDESHF